MERENVNPWKLQIENMQKEFLLNGIKKTESGEYADSANVNAKKELTPPPERPSFDESKSQILAVKQKYQESTIANDAAESKKEDRGLIQCDVCEETIEITGVTSHFNGKSHRRKMELMFMEKCVKKDKCDLCGTTFQSLVQIFDHLNGFDHAVKLVASKPNRANRSITALPSVLGINALMGRGSRGATGAGGKLKSGSSRGGAYTHGRGSSSTGGRGGRGQSLGGFGSRGRAGANVRGRGTGRGSESIWGSNVSNANVRGRGAGRGGESGWGSNASNTSIRGRGAGRGGESSWGSNESHQSNKPGGRGRSRGVASRGRMRGGRGGLSNNINDGFSASSWDIEQMLNYPQNEGGGKMLSQNWQQKRLTPYGGSNYGSQFQQDMWGAGQYDAEDDFMSWF